MRIGLLHTVLGLAPGQAERKEVPVGEGDRGLFSILPCPHLAESAGRGAMRLLPSCLRKFGIPLLRPVV